MQSNLTGENHAFSEDHNSRAELGVGEPLWDDTTSSSIYDDPDALQEPSFSFSEDDLIPSNMDWSNVSYDASSSNSEPSFYEKDPDFLYSKTGEDAVDARITVQRTLVVSEPREQRQTTPTLQSEAPIVDERKGRRISRSITSLGRKSKSSTRPPGSPTQEIADANTQRVAEDLSRSQSNQSESSKRRKSRPQTARPEDQDTKGPRAFLSRKGSKFVRKSQEPAIATPPTVEPATATPSSPRRHLSTPNAKGWASMHISALTKSDRQSNRITPLPGTVLRRTQHNTVNPMAKKNDELWSVFRTLESDYDKFESKPISLKAPFVRSSLTSFLQNYATHPSNDDLAHEDLERRVNILSKWWSGLLDMLSGNGGPPVSGLDRPTVLDAVSGLMDRPEWRQPLSEFSPLKKRPRPESPSSESQASQAQDGSDFLLESAHHNTRNLFVHYLFRQMSYVVDKMALKNAPASLVNFSGKCCAYGLFFCPGIADVLVRLWNVPTRNIKRAAESMGIAGSPALAQTSERVLHGFPQCMHSLAFTSYRATVTNLRRKPVLPMGFEKIPWRGAWVDRWCGKESDMFYVFIKYFHLLMVDFVRDEPSKEEIACTPAYILVRAQILSNVDSTLHQDDKSNSSEFTEGTVPSSFEEMLNADGPSLDLAQNAPNASRIIKANRLISLMRAFLSEPDTSRSSSAAQKLFADCVCETLQAAARATSLFDQGACFAICDFLEEILLILSSFGHHNAAISSSLDWNFWLDVFIRMARSDNTLTMIRLIALVYAAWPTITSDSYRKAELCFKFLLDPGIFLSHFNHWCPMVRSYFMRLLSWRVARCDEAPADGELEIIKTLFERILETWSYYKFYLDEATVQGLVLPSTAPCNPAPGRRLLIIRTDRRIIQSPLVDSPFMSGSPSGTPARFDPDDPRNLPGMSNGFSAAVLFEKLSSSLEQGVDASKRKSGILRSISNLRSSEARPPSKESLSEPPPSELSEPQDVPSPSEPSSRASLYEQRPSFLVSPLESQKSPGQKGAKYGKIDSGQRTLGMQTQPEFRFSIEASDRRPDRLAKDITLNAPRLPKLSQMLLKALPDVADDVPSIKATGAASTSVRYSGRALAEWYLVVNECQNFFERRRAEGVPSSKLIETPVMSPEPFKRF